MVIRCFHLYAFSGGENELLVNEYNLFIQVFSYIACARTNNQGGSLKKGFKSITEKHTLFYLVFKTKIKSTTKFNNKIEDQRKYLEGWFGKKYGFLS